MGPQMVEILAHGKYRKLACFAALQFVFALEKFEKPCLGIRPQEVINQVFPTIGHVDVLRQESILLHALEAVRAENRAGVETGVLGVLDVDAQTLGLRNAVTRQELMREYLVHRPETMEIFNQTRG